MDDLSEERREQLTLFREVTQEEDDAKARQYMEMSNWNVEQAINLHMSGALDATPSFPSQGPRGGGGGAQQGPLIERDDDQGSESGFSRAAEGAGGLVRRVMGTIGGFLNSILAPDEVAIAAAQGNGSAFKIWHERTFPDTPHPTFFEGSFRQAINHAKDNLKLLCVYLHCDSVQGAEGMCKDVLSNEFVKSLIDENCVFWAGDIVHRNFYDIARQLQVRQYPYLSVILPISADNYRVLHKADGQQATSVDGLVAILTQGADDLSRNRQELANEQNRAVQDRLLRQEQDREYQEGLAKDREAEESRRREEEARQKAREEERQAQQQREQEAQELEAKRRKLATDIVSNVEAALVAAADQPKTKIQVKFPTGQRVNRSFLQSHSLKDLFDWVESCEYSEASAPKVPSKFALSTSFPTKQLARSDETLKEAGLVPNCQILLQDLSDDDDL
ncbi:unnamed protein product [Amoebophrya sp. A25]|nr:unnamed protein product [Amoebophrya sp. A25]|eukprot:GSA25T00025460001.1